MDITRGSNSVQLSPRPSSLNRHKVPFSPFPTPPGLVPLSAPLRSSPPSPSPRAHHILVPTGTWLSLRALNTVHVPRRDDGPLELLSNQPFSFGANGSTFFHICRIKGGGGGFTTFGKGQMSDHTPEERPRDLAGSLIWRGTEIRPLPLTLRTLGEEWETGGWPLSGYGLRS